MNHKHVSDFALHLANHSSDLTAMEQAMIRKLLRNKDKLDYDHFTIANLANFLNTSTTSLHRLSKKLGYASFKLMKEDFFKTEQEDIEHHQSHDYLNKISSTYRLVYKSINEEMLNDLLKAKKITIYGMGMSSFIAKIFQIKLQLHGVLVEQYDDSRFMKLSSQKLRKYDDVIIVLSRSGRPLELIQVMSETSHKGITSILITEARQSPLKELATHVIETTYSIDDDYEIDTRINVHIALDILIQKFLVLKKGELGNETQL